MTDSMKGASAERYGEWVLPPLYDCLYLTGATASGKTPLALEIAKRLDAEIISMDSMAIYRGMDIGTAKPSLDERASVPHHLIDIVDPVEPYSVSSYVTAAHQAARDIVERGKKVLICGGTPLYLKSLIRGLFLGPEANWEFRESVESDIKSHGEEALLERLKQVDPLLSHKLHPHDHRRIIRALEVAKVTGSPLSHWQQQFDKPAPRDRCPVAVLKIDRAWLHERINGRVDQMLEQGLVSEVEQLQSQHGQLGRTALQAVGYKEVIEHQSGKLDHTEMVEAIKAHTRQFARRQEIWFRGLRELQWCETSPDKSAETTVNEIVEFFYSTHR